MKKPWLNWDYDTFRARFQEILSGDIFTRENVRKQYGLIALILFLAAVYINCGYQAQRQQKQIAELSKELESAYFEYLTISAKLVEQTRQSVVSAHLKDNGSRVQVSTSPAIQVD